MEICPVLFFKPETIQHLFFECTYARLLWMAVHIVLALNPPLNVYYLFNNWYPIRDKTLRSFFIDGSCWSIWLTRNKIVVDKCPQISLIQGMHWLLFWASLQWCEEKKKNQCRGMPQVGECGYAPFASSAWPFISQI